MSLDSFNKSNEVKECGASTTSMIVPECLKKLRAGTTCILKKTETYEDGNKTYCN